ncbi:protein SMG5 [Nilaparvata lugens]|uniref:protein SMG5 n=1 Tax=Nilaparvata lugens TaxID=108931 RepID=UPI00193CF52E|nr:protein SMG5 [Nilaparvata lugens]
MKKNYNPISDVRNENVDLTKRLYRCVSDAAHQLDDIRGNARSVRELFAPRACSLRARLRDACERLLLLGGGGVGGGGGGEGATAHAQFRRAEELLWRKAYYDVIATAKRIRKVDNGSSDWEQEEMYLVVEHINAGVGLYHHILWRLQCEYPHATTNDSLVYFEDLGLKKGINNSHSVAGNGVDKMAATGDEVRRRGEGGEEWAENLAHRCLIYLGDLFRYMVDIQPGWDYGLATHYYTQALLWKPGEGLPHNQLGTLAGSRNYSLDAVYHYMRCVESYALNTHFDGTEGNLNQLLDKSKQQLESADFLVESADCALKRAVVRLLICVRSFGSVCDALLVDLRESLHAVEVSEPIGEPDDLQQLLAMGKAINEKPQKMTEEMLFKSVVILLMCLHNLKKKGSSELCLAVSLQLSVMAQVLREIMLKVESVLPPPQTPPLHPHHRRRRRRRRRMKHRSSSCEEVSSGGSQGEEVEYMSDQDSDASEEKLIFDQNSSDSDDEINGKALRGADSDEDDLDGSEKPQRHYRDSLTFQHLHRLSQQGFLLQTIKICLDWLGSNVETLKSYVTLASDVILINEELADVPLPEDVCLRDLPPLLETQKHLNWSKANHMRISSEEETYLRVYRVLQAAARLDQCGWSLIARRKWFVATSSSRRRDKLVQHAGNKLHRQADCNRLQQHGGYKLQRHTGNKLQRNAGNKLQQHPDGNKLQQHPDGNKLQQHADGNQLPQHADNKRVPQTANGQDKSKLLGELWLRSEVNQLETRVKQRGQSANLPPYLVLDAPALISHLALAKQLVASKKFIVLVPSVVVSLLDERKRESVLVRESTRWLESQLKGGSRFVRAQRPSEHLALPLIKYPKKKDKEAWLFFQIVECCHFLSNQCGSKEPGLVTLLTGSTTLLNGSNANGSNGPNPNGSNANGFSPIGIASSAGINIEHIESFHSKWKSSSKSHG